MFRPYALSSHALTCALRGRPRSARCSRAAAAPRSLCCYRTAPRRTAPPRTAPHRAAPHRTAPHRTAPHRTAPHRTAPHRTMRYHTVLIPCHTNYHIPYHLAPHLRAVALTLALRMWVARSCRTSPKPRFLALGGVLFGQSFRGKPTDHRKQP